MLYVDVNHKSFLLIILPTLNAFVTMKYNGNIITNDLISLNKLPNKPYENRNVFHINKNMQNNIINSNIACILNQYTIQDENERLSKLTEINRIQKRNERGILHIYLNLH